MGAVRRYDGLYWHILSGRPIYTPPASIDPTGATDVAAKLNAWLTNIPDNSVVDFGSATYLLQSHLNLPSREGLVLLNGTMKRTEERPNPNNSFPEPFFWFTSPTCCRVLGTIFRGANTVSDTSDPTTGAYDADLEGDAAVRADSFSDFLVSGIDVDGVWGDGVQLNIGTGAQLLTYQVDRCGRQGSTGNGNNVLIDGLTLLHGRRSGIDVEPNTSNDTQTNVELRNCQIHTRLLAFANGGKAVIDGLYIHHNTVTATGVPVFSCGPSDTSQRQNYRFEYNTVSCGLGSPAPGVRINQVDNVSIIGNDVNVSTNQSRLAVGFTTVGGDVVVENNTWHGGIYYSNTSPQPGQNLTMNDGLILE